jgi:hypothetical protein
VSGACGGENRKAAVLKPESSPPWHHVATHARWGALTSEQRFRDVSRGQLVMFGARFQGLVPGTPFQKSKRRFMKKGGPLLSFAPLNGPQRMLLAL